MTGAQLPLLWGINAEVATGRVQAAGLMTAACTTVSAYSCIQGAPGKRMRLIPMHPPHSPTAAAKLQFTITVRLTRLPPTMHGLRTEPATAADDLN